MTLKLIDTVHLFDSTGTSMLTREHLEAKIAKLEADNAKLLRLLKKVRREMVEKGPPQPAILN